MRITVLSRVEFPVEHIQLVIVIFQQWGFELISRPHNSSDHELRCRIIGAAVILSLASAFQKLWLFTIYRAALHAEFILAVAALGAICIDLSRQLVLTVKKDYCMHAVSEFSIESRKF